MADPKRLRVKICGVTRREDALAADRAGADYVGVVLSSGFSRTVPLEVAPAILAGTRARKVAILVDETPEAAERAATTLGADVLQLSGDESPEGVAEIRARGAWTIWKSVRARTIRDVADAVERYGGTVDGILVEGWKEGSKGGSGTRVTLDPASVRLAVPQTIDFILAGGLGPDIVADAVRAFRPDAVDVSSGVERSTGIKDHDRVRAFIEAARAASVSASPSGAAR